MQLYQKVTLDPVDAVGSPGALPRALEGLDNATLADVSELAASVPDLSGHGFWPVTVVRPTPDLGHEVVETFTLELDGVSKSATATYTTERMAMADRMTAMAGAVRATMAELVAAGFVYEVPGAGATHIYQIDAVAQGNMLAVEAEFLGGVSNAHGGYWRSAANANVTMSDAEVRAFFRAAKAYKMAAIRNAQALTDAITGAADQDALDAVDLDAGWP